MDKNMNSAPELKTDVRKEIARALPNDVRGAAVLCAVSGGADSMTLLHAMSALSADMGFLACAAHFNHSLRAGADADENFVERWCAVRGIPFHSQKGDVASYAKKTGRSIETAAREMRYKFLRETAHSLGAKYIALGHHAMDQAETLLLNLARGTGLSGLRGMAEVHGDLIRPMLHVNKETIMEYVSRFGIEYREDETNSLPDYSRNRVRAVIAELEKVNTAFVTNACRAAELARRDEEALEHLALDELGALQLPGGIDAAKLLSLMNAVRSRVVRIAARHAGLCADLESRHVDDVLALCEKSTGKRINLPHGYVARVDYGALSIVPASASAEKLEYEIPLNLNAKTLTPHGAFYCQTADRPKALGKNWPHQVELDSGALDGAVVRTRRAGDVIHPLGAPGTKKLKDYFIDKKVPAHMRNGPVVARANEVLWAVGHAISQRVALNGESEVCVVRFAAMNTVDFDEVLHA